MDSRTRIHSAPLNLSSPELDDLRRTKYEAPCFSSFLGFCGSNRDIMKVWTPSVPSVVGKTGSALWVLHEKPQIE